MKKPGSLVRPSIARLVPYSSARDEFSGTASVYLDANENPYNGPYNRYPDPHQLALKEKVGRIKNIDPGNIFLETVPMKPSISCSAFSVNRGRIMWLPYRRAMVCTGCARI